MSIVYKPPGYLNTEIANKEKDKLNKKKVCICGKLDPLAEGELLLLFDDECKLMNYYLSKRKIYQWEIIWGLQTDTEDVMGLIQNDININFDENYLLKIMNTFVGDYLQNFHHYSSIQVKNSNLEKNPLWKWSKENRLDEIVIPNKLVNVKYIKLLNTRKINLNSIKPNIINTIKKVQGDFRQIEIISQWEKYPNKEYYVSKFEADVSSGFYIRELVKQLGISTNYLGLTLNINRIKIII